ncbi:hypothetical protein NBRC116188_17220 [Oceaniserpentilla sp. 4NH20-0058]|uniref:hypothetical protein n=1 Tax=Oceaniserpentilla sp. 4NH20-0058 TaxID=3127660 RepID=UPI0031086935
MNLWKIFEFLNSTYINMSTLFPTGGRGAVRSTLDGDNTSEENWMIIGIIFLLIIGVFYYLKSKEIKPTRFGKKRTKNKD